MSSLFTCHALGFTVLGRPLFRTALHLLASVGFLGCLQSVASTGEQNPAARETHPIRAFTQTTGLAPSLERPELAAWTAGVDVLGLGEQIHGSAGFSRAKAQLAASLVEHHGFRQIAFEFSWSDMEPVEAALARCAGGTQEDPVPSFRDTGVGGTMGMDSAIVELMDWACAYNRSHPDDTVHVAGFDGQQPWHDMRHLVPALERRLSEPEARAVVRNLHSCHGARFESREQYRAYGVKNHFPVPTPEEHTHCLRGLAQTTQALEDTPVDPRVQRALDGLTAFELANQALLVHGRVQEAYDHREAFLVETIRSLASSPSTRTLVWAHNKHVSKDSLAILGTARDPDRKHQNQGYQSFGSLLDQDPSVRYEAIAFVGLEVQTTLGAVHAPPVPTQPEALEVMLQQDPTLRDQDLLVDLAHWAPAGQRVLLGGEWQTPRDQYRGLVLLQNSPAR